MNEFVTSQSRRPSTQAAEGLPRWRWTVAEVEKLYAAGFFPWDARFELVGGEIVPMAPRGRRHEIIRGVLAFQFTRMAPTGVFVIAEPQYNLADDEYLMPDILLHPAAIKTPDVRGPDALLVIEIADTSLGSDLRVKAPRYAGHGVREYWVINANTLVTTVFADLRGGAYTKSVEIAGEETLTPSLVPALSLSLRNLDLD